MLFLRVAEVLAQSSGRFAWKLPRYQWLGLSLHPWELRVDQCHSSWTYMVPEAPNPTVQHRLAGALATGVPFLLQGSEALAFGVPHRSYHEIFCSIYKNLTGRQIHPIHNWCGVSLFPPNPFIC